MRSLRRSLSAGVVAVALAFVGVATTTTYTPGVGAESTPATGAAVQPISHVGRWLTDATGRVLLVHGVNVVAKTPGETPADMGFGDDDAEWIAGNGFDVVRLGTTAASIMPTPGVIDTAYVDAFAQTVHMLTAHGLLVLVDLHQDGWGPSAGGEPLGSDGFPDWMTLTHGAQNTQTSFPLYYITNPAIQAAFQSFWDDDSTSDRPLQDSTARIWKALAGAVSSDSGVIGYDLLNEPWPGTTWQGCVTATGCPAQDAALSSYNSKMAAAVRSQDPTHLLFGEHYVLFNFGQGPTHIGLPGNDPQSGMSWHMYTNDPKLEPAVIDYAKQWSAQTGGALLNTEFGAVSDPVQINRMTGELDSALMPWIWWAYNEEILPDMNLPPTDENLHSLDTVNAIVRPHADVVAGTPEASDYDPAARRLTFSYSTTRVGGGSFAPDTVTSFQIPERSYPRGYQVAVSGGHVVSAPNAQHLLVVANAGSTCISVATAPVGATTPVVPADGCSHESPTTPSGRPNAQPAAAVARQPSFTG